MIVHYAGRWHMGGTPLRWLPACGAEGLGHLETTNDRPLVTCRSCKRTHRYRDGTRPGP